MLHTIADGTRDVNQQRIIYPAHARDHGFTYQPGEMCELDRQPRDVQIDAIRAQDGELVLEPSVKERCHVIDNQQQAEPFNTALRARAFRSGATMTLQIASERAGAAGSEMHFDATPSNRPDNRIMYIM
jgi:NADH dehydrogenase